MVQQTEQLREDGERPRLRFRILGPLQVIGPNGPLSLGGAKQRAVLALLVLRRNEVVPSERLIDDLWDGKPPESASGILRTYISLLRKAMDGGAGTEQAVLLTRPPGYLLQIDVDQLDSLRFERLLQDAYAATAARGHHEALGLLDKALRLWRGPALADFSYAPFAKTEIARLEEMRFQAIEEQVEAGLALGQHGMLVGRLEQLVAQYPLRERFSAQLMLALYRCGRQTEALRAYSRVRTTLGSELGIEPSSLLKSLELAILNQDRSLDLSPAPSQTTVGSPNPPSAAETSSNNGRLAGPGQVRPEPVFHSQIGPDAHLSSPVDGAQAAGQLPSDQGDDASLPTPSWPQVPYQPRPMPLARPLHDALERPLVGRAQELSRWHECWQAALERRRPSLVLFTGPAGIGKTRLVAEVASSVRDKGALVAYGRCDEEQIAPFQPIAQAIRDYVSCLGEEFAYARLDPAAAELVRLAPQLSRQPPDKTAEASSDGELQRYRMFEAAAALLGDTGDQPLLLVLDDLHWVDTPSLLLLRHLLRYSASRPLVVVGTYRDTDVELTDPLAQTLADLRRDDLVERVALGGLSGDEATELIRQVLPTDSIDRAPELTPALERITEGNPFFLREIVRHLAETGTLHRLASDDQVLAEHLPQEVTALLARRLGRLSPRSVSVLRFGAVIGPEFDLPLLSAAGNMSEDDLLDALDEAVAARLLEEVPPTVDRFRFSHALLRETLYGQLTHSRRARLHRQVGEALEQYIASTPEKHVAEVAHHFAMAAPVGTTDKALTYARQAGDQSLAMAAYEDAAAHYHRGLELIKTTSAANGSSLFTRCDLLLALGQAYNNSGQLASGKDVFLQAADLARALGHGQMLARAALGFGGSVPVGADLDDLRPVELLEEALSMLGEEDSPHRALALARLSQWHYRSRPREERRALNDQALTIATRLADPPTLARVLSHRYWTLLGPDDVEDRLATGREIVRLGESLGRKDLVLEGTQCCIHALLELGDMEETRRAATRRDRLAEQLRDPQSRWGMLAFQALEALMDGRFGESEMLAHQARQSWCEADPVRARTVYLAQLFALRWLQGRLIEVTPGLEAMAEGFPQRPVWRTILAWVYAETGCHDRARHEVEQVRSQGLDNLPRTLDWSLAVVGLTMATRRLADEHLAAELYDLLVPYSGRNCVLGQSVYYGAASHYLGMLAATTGRFDAAVSHLQAALRRHQCVPARPFVALTKRELALALERRGARGDCGRASELRAESRAMASTLGMDSLLSD